jgi:hypothetical protein
MTKSLETPIQWSNEVIWRSKLHGFEREDHASHEELLEARANGIERFIPQRYDAALTVIDGRLSRKYGTSSFGEVSTYMATIARTTGALVEVGGPTRRYDEPLEKIEKISKRLDRKVHVLNIVKTKGVDVLADTSNLPFDSESLGLVTASCLPTDAREHFFREAFRTLEAGGVIAYQRANDLDFSHTLALGFEPLVYSQSPRTDTGEEFTTHPRFWTFAAQKPS